MLRAAPSSRCWALMFPRCAWHWFRRACFVLGRRCFTRNRVDCRMFDMMQSANGPGSAGAALPMVSACGDRCSGAGASCTRHGAQRPHGCRCWRSKRYPWAQGLCRSHCPAPCGRSLVVPSEFSSVGVCAVVVGSLVAQASVSSIIHIVPPLIPPPVWISAFNFA